MHEHTRSATSKLPFGQWLLGQRTRTDVVGELASCAARDPGFPRNGNVDAVSCRLNALGADGYLHLALEDAELDYHCH